MDNPLKGSYGLKVFLPFCIGIACVMLFVYKDERFSWDVIGQLQGFFVPALVCCLPLILLRDGGYVYRIRAITEGKVTLRGSVYVVLLWEFASAVTPSIVGGTAIAVYVLYREGLSAGKAFALVLLTSIADNAFFVLMAPVALLLTPSEVFPDAVAGVSLTRGLSAVFWISYGMIATYTVLMVWALFVSPRSFKLIVFWISKLKLIRKWRKSWLKHAAVIADVGFGLRGKHRSYWFRLVLATLTIWFSRYALINALAWSLGIELATTQLLIFARQAVLWVIMLVSITPGGSGLAELFFDAFYYPLLGASTLAVALLWRFFSYYPYLIGGSVALPLWMRRLRKKKDSTEVLES